MHHVTPSRDTIKRHHQVRLQSDSNLLCGQEAKEPGWGRSFQLHVDSTASACSEEEGAESR